MPHRFGEVRHMPRDRKFDWAIDRTEGNYYVP
ncbi:hypothetical protein BH23ACT10_BH23ACT10_29470 [soil metagenome]